MKDTLKPGLTITKRIKVDEPRTISFMGDKARIYSTPQVVNDAEYTCRELILEHHGDDEDSVGTRVEINHIGATLLGMEVEFTASVIAVEGRLVTFEWTARDDVEEIANGQHTRFVVDIEKTFARLQAKAEKAGL